MYDVIMRLRFRGQKIRIGLDIQSSSRSAVAGLMSFARGIKQGCAKLVEA